MNNHTEKTVVIDTTFRTTQRVKTLEELDRLIAAKHEVVIAEPGSRLLEEINTKRPNYQLKFLVA